MHPFFLAPLSWHSKAPKVRNIGSHHIAFACIYYSRIFPCGNFWRSNLFNPKGALQAHPLSETCFSTAMQIYGKLGLWGPSMCISPWIINCHGNRDVVMSILNGYIHRWRAPFYSFCSDHQWEQRTLFSILKIFLRKKRINVWNMQIQ